MKKRLINTSTHKFIEEARQVHGYTLMDFIHGYIYGRWTYLYIGIGKGDHPIGLNYRKFKAKLNEFGEKLPIKRKRTIKDVTLADGYHGKVLPLEISSANLYRSMRKFDSLI